MNNGLCVPTKDITISYSSDLLYIIYNRDIPFEIIRNILNYDFLENYMSNIVHSYVKYSKLHMTIDLINLIKCFKKEELKIKVCNNKNITFNQILSNLTEVVHIYKEKNEYQKSSFLYFMSK